MKKKFVISGYYGFKNFGDEAILAVIVKKLLSWGNKITVISSDPEYTKSLYNQVKSVKTFDFKSIIWSIYNSHYLISGGGSLLQDATSLKSLFYYLSVIFIALILKKKVIIFAQGIGPIYTPVGQFFTKLLLSRCHYISVRDKKSQELLQQWGINSELVCDPIFSLKIPDTYKLKTVAVQLRHFPGMNNDFLHRLADAVSRNFPKYNVEIYSFQDEIDYEVCKKFEKYLNMLNPDIDTTLFSGLTNEEIMTNISKCEFLVSMRLHAIIIGLLTSVKTMCIDYDIKIEKIAKEFNLPLINMKNGFGDKFAELKNQNLFEIDNKVSQVDFDWSGIENAIK